MSQRTNSQPSNVASLNQNAANDGVAEKPVTLKVFHSFVSTVQSGGRRNRSSNNTSSTAVKIGDVHFSPGKEATKDRNATKDTYLFQLKGMGIEGGQTLFIEDPNFTEIQNKKKYGNLVLIEHSHSGDDYMYAVGCGFGLNKEGKDPGIRITLPKFLSLRPGAELRFFLDNE